MARRIDGVAAPVVSETLLMISGGVEALEGIRRAKEMGLRVVVVDGSPEAPGFALADAQLIVSTYDVDGVVTAAREYHESAGPLHGVISVAADVPLTVAAVASDLGLQGISLESAALAADKLAMKHAFVESGVATAWFSAVPSAEALIEITEEQGLPLVLKPVDSRGARGVLRLDATVDLTAAFEESKRSSPSGRVMVERFLDGPQVSTESILLGGTTHTPGFADRNYEYMDRFAPNIIENGGDLPTRLDESARARVDALIGAAAKSMGITDGVVKGDIVIVDDEPHVIELAARLSGGYFCTHEIPLSTGVDFLGAAIRVALGRTVNPADLEPRYERGVAQRCLFPRGGRVIGIEGVDEVAARPEVVLCEIRVEPGDVIESVSSHAARAGMVIAIGADRAEAVCRAEQAVNDIQIVTEPLKETHAAE